MSFIFLFFIYNKDYGKFLKLTFIDVQRNKQNIKKKDEKKGKTKKNIKYLSD